MSDLQPTDPEIFLNSLDAGTLSPRLGKLLTHIATSVMQYQRKGKVELKFVFEQFNKGSQIKVDAVLEYTTPTAHGTESEKQKSITLFYVTQRGNMTDLPDKQNDFFKKTNHETEIQKEK